MVLQPRRKGQASIFSLSFRSLSDVRLVQSRPVTLILKMIQFAKDRVLRFLNKKVRPFQKFFTATRLWFQQTGKAKSSVYTSPIVLIGVQHLRDYCFGQNRRRFHHRYLWRSYQHRVAADPLQPGFVLLPQQTSKLSSPHPYL